MSNDAETPLTRELYMKLYERHEALKEASATAVQILHLHEDTIDKLEAKLAALPPAMTWTSEKPVKPGKYWYLWQGGEFIAFIAERGPSTPYLLVVLVNEWGIIASSPLSDSTWDGQWAGPLEPPQ